MKKFVKIIILGIAFFPFQMATENTKDRKNSTELKLLFVISKRNS